METRNYICEYCKKDYIPKRRKVQKYCSNGCRVRSHQLKTKTTKELGLQKSISTPEKIKVDKMSMAGVGNSVAGTLAVEGLKALFIREENKPATKLDILKLGNKIKRYQEVKNIPINIYGKKPFFDNVLGLVIYI